MDILNWNEKWLTYFKNKVSGLNGMMYDQKAVDFITNSKVLRISILRKDCCLYKYEDQFRNKYCLSNDEILYKMTFFSSKTFESKKVDYDTQQLSFIFFYDTIKRTLIGVGFTAWDYKRCAETIIPLDRFFEDVVGIEYENNKIEELYKNFFAQNMENVIEEIKSLGSSKENYIIK